MKKRVVKANMSPNVQAVCEELLELRAAVDWINKRIKNGLGLIDNER